MLRLRTNARGPMAVIGEMVDMMGMDCRTAFARKITLERRVNCRSKDLGRKVAMLYLAVSILFPLSSFWRVLSRSTRDSSATLGNNMPMQKIYPHL